MLLNCHSYFSMKYGTLSVKDLLEEVRAKGYELFALTDINNTSGWVETARQLLEPEDEHKEEKKERKSSAVLGIDFRNGTDQKYVGIAKNNQGLYQLSFHLSQHLHAEEAFKDIAPPMDDVYIIYPFSKYRGWDLRSYEMVGVSEQDLGTYAFMNTKIPAEKLVIQQTLTFRNKKDFNAHRLLRAIDNNVLLSRLPVSEQSSPLAMVPPKEMLVQLFQQYPVMVSNTQRILRECCNIDFGFHKFGNKNKAHFTDSVEEDTALLKQLAHEGLEYRYGKNPSEVIWERLERELTTITEMGFASYFLINWDIVNYARRQGYYYVGRGSGANSMVAYLLRITDVDPIELDLYFERFINRFRSTPPDFDIDFSWTDRDDITRYIFEKYGKDGKAALLGSYNTFQHDAIIRELGKVYGYPADEIDQIQRVETRAQYLALDSMAQQIFRYARYFKDFPNHNSIHASGILISEEPVYCYTATFIPPKGFPTTHFSMIEAEDIGLYKFDILSQRGLGKIKDALEIVKTQEGVEPDLHDMQMLKQDEAIKVLLREGKAIGCFYVESPAMRMLLRKLRADDYLRLVAASSIIRPGVAKSGMMREYIVRYRHVHLREAARRELPELYDLLEETYGVMVYQEDVIKIAHCFADLTLAESDYLRRGMSWKFKQRNEFHMVEQKFFTNCHRKGYDPHKVAEVWKQIESFANFAFSKGHSASYAVESYQALYLKAHYPLAYMTATLNNGGGFYRPEVYLHEAHMHGGEIEPPCVNTSTDLCVLKGKKIYAGLNMIAELQLNTIGEILYERNKNGNFNDLDDFIRRVPVSLEQLRLLIRVGAFRFTGSNKRKLLWDAHMQLSKSPKRHLEKELFEIKPVEFKLPELEHNRMDDLFEEMELLGFTRKLPFDLLKNKPVDIIKACEMHQHLEKTVRMLGYHVTTKYTSASNGSRMYFGTFLDENGDWIDTVHFPPSAKAYPFTGKGCYLITGIVKLEFDFYSLEVTKQERIPYYDREDIIDEPEKNSKTEKIIN